MRWHRAPDTGIPRSLLVKARCIVVVPGVKKAAVGFGGQYGRGYISCRQPGGAWSAPGGVRIEGGSIGLQIGGSDTDVIMAVMNERGVDRLLSSRFTIGADAAVAAGPDRTPGVGPDGRNDDGRDSGVVAVERGVCRAVAPGLDAARRLRREQGALRSGAVESRSRDRRHRAARGSECVDGDIEAIRQNEVPGSGQAFHLATRSTGFPFLNPEP